ncbi:hypothetical protein ColKHC_04918 [Colletotrichum higginsianum]|nr:hypothetical protein ColKHC_04918 [Colletotrichum higginsianum]
MHFRTPSSGHLLDISTQDDPTDSATIFRGPPLVNRTPCLAHEGIGRNKPPAETVILHQNSFAHAD